MKPVNILKFKIDKKRSLGRDLVLFVDSENILDLIEESIPQNYLDKKWYEKKDAKFVRDNLLKSTKSSGNFDLIICVHCERADDLMLNSILVSHIEEFIIWEIRPPISTMFCDDYSLLKFVFHKKQYIETINKIFLI